MVSGRVSSVSDLILIVQKTNLSGIFSFIDWFAFEDNWAESYCY